MLTPFTSSGFAPLRFAERWSPWAYSRRVSVSAYTVNGAFPSLRLMTITLDAAHAWSHHVLLDNDVDTPVPALMR